MRERMKKIINNGNPLDRQRFVERRLVLHARHGR